MNAVRLAGPNGYLGSLWCNTCNNEVFLVGHDPTHMAQLGILFTHFFTDEERWDEMDA